MFERWLFLKICKYCSLNFFFFLKQHHLFSSQVIGDSLVVNWSESAWLVTVGFPHVSSLRSQIGWKLDDIGWSHLHVSHSVGSLPGCLSFFFFHMACHPAAEQLGFLHKAVKGLQMAAREKQGIPLFGNSSNIFLHFI